MSFGLSRSRTLSDAGVGVTAAELPVLPDSAISDPEAGRVDPRAWFPHPERPLEVEIGSGKGTFLLNQAAADPGTNYLGIEYAREFYLYAADRVRRRGLANVRMVHTAGDDLLRWRCPSGVVRTIHLYFSDPWPKRKHHKNRVVQDRFLAEAWRVLEVGGELRLVTDHDELWAWYQEHVARWTSLGGAVPRELRAGFGLPDPPFEARPFAPPPWTGEDELVGTNYERKFKREDRPAHAVTLRKRG